MTSFNEKAGKTVLAFFILSLLFIPSFAFASDHVVKKAGVVVYEADEKREAVCEKMNEFAQVKWSIGHTIEYEYKSGYFVALTAGTYRGMPYTQYYRNFSDTEALQSEIEKAYETSYVPGLDCSSATAYAFRYVTGNDSASDTYMMGDNKAYNTSSFLIDAMRDDEGTAVSLKNDSTIYRNNVTKLGYYGNYENYQSQIDTVNILEMLLDDENYDKGTVYDNVYAKIKPGDMLVKVKETGGHIMVVSSVKLVYKEDGLIDPDKSKVYIIDQSRPNRSVFSDGTLSSWRNDLTVSSETGNRNNVFSFTTLATSQYLIPITAWPSEKEYTVSYDLDGGKGKVLSQTKKSYIPLTLTSIIPEKTGYTFSNWKSTSNPAEICYEAGGTYFEEADDTLVAVWNANKGKVRYDANGGSGGPSYQTQYYGTPLKISSKEPSLKGYAFSGWAYSKDAEEADFQAGSYFEDDSRLQNASGNDITLYAVWKKDIGYADVELSQSSFKYTGNEQIPEVTVLYEDEVLKEGTDYTVTLPKSSISGGNYEIVINGTGSFGGQKIAAYKISRFSQSLKTNKSKYVTNIKKKSFRIKASAKTDISFSSSNKKVAVVDQKGNVTIKGVGSCNISLKAALNEKYYSAVKKVKVIVKPEKTSISSVKKYTKSVVLRWYWKNSAVDGYQIAYSTSSKMNSIKKIKVSGKKKHKKKITGLKSGKRYYFKIRTYRKSGGKVYYSDWSKKVSMKAR